MKRLLFVVCAAGLLSACYCKCTTQNGTPTPADASVEPMVTSAVLPPQPIAQPISTPAETVSTAKHTTSTETKAVARATETATSVQPAATKEPTPISFSPEQAVPSASFGPEQAAALIAKQRAAATLKQTPADTPAFKKEEILPTAGRLLNPLAYEPILPDNTHAPWSNESLKYGIYYSFIKAGTAYIKTRGITQYNGKSAYLIQTTAFSASAIDAVFKVRDVNYSWLDTNTLHSLGYSQSVREGNYVRDEWLAFDHENGRFYGEIRKKEEPRVIAGELDQQVLDMLSSLYYVRSQPLEVGKDISFDIINREQRYPLLVKVLGKETVKTKAGKFDCWVVEPQFRGEGIFVAKGKSLKVWLTDDKYRMPVKMSVEVFIGSVYAELLEYKRN